MNGAVDDLLDGEALTRVLAQVEITFSNSMIEAFWRSLKHSWLYLHSLDSFSALRRLTEFYIKAHDGRKRSFRVVPHTAFEGQTPNEMFFGAGDKVTEKLFAARKTAREERMKETEPRDAEYASGRRLRGRCYCNGPGPECRETQQGLCPTIPDDRVRSASSSRRCSTRAETKILDRRGDTALMGGTKMAARKKAGTISRLRKAMAKDVASLKANHRKEAAALRKQVAAVRKRAVAEVAKLKREAAAEIAKLKKATTKKKATKKKAAKKKATRKKR